MLGLMLPSFFHPSQPAVDNARSSSLAARSSFPNPPLLSGPNEPPSYPGTGNKTLWLHGLDGLLMTHSVIILPLYSAIPHKEIQAFLWRIEPGALPPYRDRAGISQMRPLGVCCSIPIVFQGIWQITHSLF